MVRLIPMYLLGFILILACETKKNESSAQLRDLECGKSSQRLCNSVQSDLLLGETQVSAKVDNDILELVASFASTDELQDPEAPPLLLTGVQSYANYSPIDVNTQNSENKTCHELVGINNNILVIKVNSDLRWLAGDTRSQKSCLLNLGLRYPENLTFAIDQVHATVLTSDELINLATKFKLGYISSSSQNVLWFTTNITQVSQGYKLGATKEIWSSCSGEDVIGLKTIFEKQFLQDLEDIDFNFHRDTSTLVEDSVDVNFQNGIYLISLKWKGC